MNTMTLFGPRTNPVKPPEESMIGSWVSTVRSPPKARSLGLRYLTWWEPQPWVMNNGDSSYPKSYFVHICINILFLIQKKLSILRIKWLFLLLLLKVFFANCVMTLKWPSQKPWSGDPSDQVIVPRAEQSGSQKLSLKSFVYPELWYLAA